MKPWLLAAAVTTAAAAATAHAEPHAGSVSLQMRYEDQTTASDTGTVLGMSGFQVGLGARITDRWYAGATGELALGMNMGTDSDSFVTSLRAGGEARYIFHRGEAASLDEDGNVIATHPRLDYVGVRAGAQSVDGARGAFGEVELGGNAWLGNTTQLGLFFNIGINAEPPGAYGEPPPPEPPVTLAPAPEPPSMPSYVISPYFTFGAELAFG
ncbi:MAG TPA: hypothetical protein VGF94_22015 [Kofleriaceae bacterium]|jgi:hypothetical protein